MKNDPGLFTDSTGDGMAGETDVSFDTINHQNIPAVSRYCFM